MMEHKFVDFQVKADGENRVITGYGSVFGERDLGGDVVMPGAFAKSIASGRRPAMLHQHRASEVIGVWSKVSEDEKGLLLEGQLADTTQGLDIYKLLKMDAFRGLSIGYRVLEEEWDGPTRMIKEAELWEVSLVTFPMNESATVDAVKAADMTRREMERLLTQDAGLSRGVARKLMDGGFEAVSTKQDAGADEERELIETLRSWSKS